MHKFEFVDNPDSINWKAVHAPRVDFMDWGKVSDMYALDSYFPNANICTTRLIHNPGNEQFGKYIFPNWVQKHSEFYNSWEAESSSLLGFGPFDFDGHKWCVLLLERLPRGGPAVHDAAVVRLDGYGHLPSIPEPIIDQFNYLLTVCCINSDMFTRLAIETYLQDNQPQLLGPQRILK